jgi:hypothetical protein
MSVATFRKLGKTEQVQEGMKQIWMYGFGWGVSFFYLPRHIFDDVNGGCTSLMIAMPAVY